MSFIEWLNEKKMMRQLSKEMKEQWFDLPESHKLFEEFELIRTKRFLKKIRRLNVYIPPAETKSDYWRLCSHKLEFYLSDFGFRTLEKEYRTERKLRREEKFWWIPLVALGIALTALIIRLIAGL